MTSLITNFWACVDPKKVRAILITIRIGQRRVRAARVCQRMAGGSSTFLLGIG